MTLPSAPSDAEAARIVQETADVLFDDLTAGASYIELTRWDRDRIRQAIAEAVERWRIYARGGEQFPPKEPR